MTGSLKGRAEFENHARVNKYYSNWIKYFIFADTASDWIRVWKPRYFKKFYCLLSHGHVSMIGSLIYQTHYNIHNVDGNGVLHKRLSSNFFQNTSLSNLRVSLPERYHYRCIHQSSMKMEEFSNKCTLNVDNTVEWSNRNYILFFMGQIRSLKDIRYWAYRYLSNFSLPNTVFPNSNTESMNRNIIVNTNTKVKQLQDSKHCNISVISSQTYSGVNIPQNMQIFPCTQTSNKELYAYLLSHSKFNLAIAGGDPCTSRFYDALALNVINIVVSDDFENCFIGDSKFSQIPWHKMIIRIKQKDFKQNPTLSLQQALQNYTIQDFKDMLQLIESYKSYILWDRINSKSAYVLLSDAVKKCNEENI